MILWKQNVQSSLSKFPIKKYAKDYHEMFELVRDELLQSLKEMHPVYNNCKSTHLYQICVIYAYLKGISRGNDVHVICYGDEEHSCLHDLIPALAAKMDIEWNIA